MCRYESTPVNSYLVKRFQHKKVMIYIYIYMYVSIHTNKQTNTHTHTHTHTHTYIYILHSHTHTHTHTHTEFNWLYFQRPDTADIVVIHQNTDVQTDKKLYYKQSPDTQIHTHTHTRTYTHEHTHNPRWSTDTISQTVDLLLWDVQVWENRR